TRESVAALADSRGVQETRQEKRGQNVWGEPGNVRQSPRQCPRQGRPGPTPQPNRTDHHRPGDPNRTDNHRPPQQTTPTTTDHHRPPGQITPTTTAPHRHLSTPPFRRRIVLRISKPVCPASCET